MNQPPLPTALYNDLEVFINVLEDKKGSLISVLHYAQELFGYLPTAVQLYVARKLDIPAAKVYGVVSFYSYFTTTPKGVHQIKVCMGTACFIRDADKILTEIETLLNIKSGQVSDDGLFSIDSLRCVGACGLAPVVIVGEKVYGRVKAEDIPKILEECEKEVVGHG